MAQSRALLGGNRGCALVGARPAVGNGLDIADRGARVSDVGHFLGLKTRKPRAVAGLRGRGLNSFETATQCPVIAIYTTSIVAVKRLLAFPRPG